MNKKKEGKTALLHLPKRATNHSSELIRQGDQDWLANRSHQAMIALRDYIESDPKRLGGIPVFKGTRFSVPQLFAELADSDAIADIAADLDLSAAKLRKFLHALAVYLNRPVTT